MKILKLEIEDNMPNNMSNSTMTYKSAKNGVVTVEDLVEVIANFCYQQNIDMNQIGEALSIDHPAEEYVDIVSRAFPKSSNKEIQNMVENEDNRKAFLEQLQNNSEMLKEVFKLYLQETLELYVE